MKRRLYKREIKKSKKKERKGKWGVFSLNCPNSAIQTKVSKKKGTITQENKKREIRRLFKKLGER
jgi:anaerobic ribonucleoside-triphosphate reductase